MEKVSESEPVEIEIGASSSDIRLRRRLDVTMRR